MTAISTAVDLNRVSAIVGYEIQASLEGIAAGNLPQKIGILAEANTANQAGLPSSLNFTTAKEVGDIMGYGSPAYHIARILRPASGDLLGGIPTVVYPVAEAGGATASTSTVTVTGTATKTVTHKLKINGRDQIDGTSYTFVVEKDDTATAIAVKIQDAVNAVIGAPGTALAAVADCVVTSKWAGLSSAELTIEVDQLGDAAGITYSVANVAGAGTPDIATALAAIGEEWVTLLINGIGSDTTTLDSLEAKNGNPNDNTGNYLPTVFTPFVSLFGDNSVDTLAEATSLMDGRKAEVTNSLCPAPASPAFSFEAPANVAFIYGKIAQDEPQTDPIYRLYPDMPAADDISEFADPTKRDQIVKVGCSTVKINSSKYQIVDLVTTYHPDEEPATATLFRWVRDLVGVDWNVKYSYQLLEEIFVVGKTILPDGVASSAANTISPSRWKAQINGLADDLQDRALVADAAFMKGTIQVQIGESNPNRFETTFKAQRTGTARVLSTTNQTLFKFGA
jgi:phage tail sheath gpL-like